MKIIADSGSTKTAWRLITDKKSIVAVESPGINPYYQGKEEILDSLKEYLLPHIKEEVREIYFYGAGCTGTKGDLVREAISEVISASIIEVNSDLLGAARALCGNEPGIACILGTGSNSCYYNGEIIVRNIPPLGFILGDEGSGAVLGKKLVADYLKYVMPSSLRLQFEVDCDLTTSEVLNRVYRSEFPNRYLSGFTPFLSKNIRNSYCEKLVVSEFQEFIARNVLNYKESKDIPVSFTGSVAYYFESQLKMVLQSNGLTVGKIIQHPIDLLVDFHGHGIKS
jgi:N-acetylglucosamine kinase-like BadF-type ATPase